MNVGQTDNPSRFSLWNRLPARLLLAALAALLIAAALVPIKAGTQKTEVAGAFDKVAGIERPQAQRPRDDDLALYDHVIARVGNGENYYAVAADEHRKAHYPLRPGVAVRLPTLTWLAITLGDKGRGADVVVPGELAAAILLMVATLWAWWRRLGDEGVDPRTRRFALALLFLGASLALNRYYFVLHELWAGMLLALAMGLHRPGHRWLGAAAAAGLALALREHALPFVLLMAALAVWRRNWTEAATWAALVIAFFAYLGWHLEQVGLVALPSDPEGPDWLTFRGLSGWLSNVVLSGNIRSLPHFIAGPLVILAVFGWAGWKGRLGTFATLLYLGYGLAFMIAGRPDNFYWGAMVAPALFVGLAFVPMAAKGLVRAAR